MLYGYMEKTSKKMGTFHNVGAVITISDTHCGSDVGLMPPPGSFTLYDGSKNTQNPLQALLWRAFVADTQKALNSVKGVGFALILNGDLIEGIHHRSDEVASAKIEDHKRCAVYCLDSIAKKAQKTVVVMGTECHTRRDEHGLGRELGAISPSNRPDLYAFDGLDLKINGCLVNTLHHMPCSSRAYLEASHLGIVMGNAILNRARDRQPVPNIFLRGHRHTAGYYCDGRSMICVQGSYQFKTRHGMKVVPDSGTFPSITTLNWKGKQFGELPSVEMIGRPISQIDMVE